jgi:hypothetical protein
LFARGKQPCSDTGEDDGLFEGLFEGVDVGLFVEVLDGDNEGVVVVEDDGLFEVVGEDVGLSVGVLEDEGELVRHVISALLSQLPIAPLHTQSPLLLKKV